jgi:exopolyphosphatase / guanosine-5'-triphosphate,3'-diphosphate pyrophosphatase
VNDRPPIGASVDLGSNSVHLLVASVAGHGLTPLADESAFLGLGAAVDDYAALGPARRAELVDTLVRYATTARQLGASRITFMGTEPIRRAADSARIVVDVETASGVPLHVLTHEEEAYLTLVGVTAGLPVAHETLVVDIGGGSSEFCAVAAGGRARAAGLRLGSNRLMLQFVRDDPPTPQQIEAMATAADGILRTALPAAPTDLVLVGGTASNLLKVTAAGITDRVVTGGRVAEALATLTSADAAATSARFLVNPTRARLLPAGAVIVDAIMRRYGVDAVRVSEEGMREGAILVAEHAGRAWRDRLPELAHGWRQ